MEIDDGVNDAYHIDIDSNQGLHIHNQVPGSPTTIDVASADADGTDNVKLKVYAVGDDGATDTERLTFGYNASATRMEIASKNSGTGTLRDLHIYTDADTDQFVIKADGTVEYQGVEIATVNGITPVTPTTYTPSGTTQTITFADNDQLAILDLGSATGNVTLTLSGMSAGGAYTIKVIQGATARNLVFPSGVIASSNQTAWDQPTRVLTMTAVDDSVDVVGLSYDGTSTLMTAEFDLS